MTLLNADIDTGRRLPDEDTQSYFPFHELEHNMSP
jgi:hypothetical protein